MMADANQEYLDASLRHQVFLRRYSSRRVRQMLEVLDESEKELAEKLRARLEKFQGKKLDFQGQAWQALLEDIRAAREAAIQVIAENTMEEMGGLAKIEAATEAAILTASIPIEISLAAVAEEQLAALVSSMPFEGRLLGDWFKGLAATDQSRMVQALQMGMAQGESIDEIVRRIVGAEGVAGITRRDATAIIRTAVNHVSNDARDAVMDANSDIIAAKIWVSTLDGRTSAVCRARDGKGARVGGKPLPEGVEELVPQNAIPPAHFNCRSVMVAVIDGVGLVGNRPTVTDTRTREKREIDFEEIAKREGKKIAQVRREWAEANIGRVPAKTSYEEWLKRQPKEFQEDVLGVEKAELFRDGKISLDKFVDFSGKELTLDELKSTIPGPEDTESAKWAESAFKDAPDVLKRAAKKTKVEEVINDPKRGAFFRNATRNDNKNLIQISSKQGTQDADYLYAHELGHAMDYDRINDTYQSHDPRVGVNLQKELSKDEKGLMAAKEYREKNQSKIQKEWEKLKNKIDASAKKGDDQFIKAIDKELKPFGLSFKDAQKFIDDNFYTLSKYPGYDKGNMWSQMILSLKYWDPENLINTFTLRRREDMEKGSVMMLSDAANACTKGKICRLEDGFSAHERKYYDRVNAEEGIGAGEAKEFFANHVSLRSNGGEFITKVMTHFFPNGAKAADRLIERVAK